MPCMDAVPRRATISLYALVLWSLLVHLAAAREYLILRGEPVLPGEEELDLARVKARQNNNNNYQFTGALAIYGDGGGNGQTYSSPQQTGSTAVQAQCPASHPVSCTSIQEPYYCCPANNYCAWSNSQVSCCPNGATCYAQGEQWQPTSTYYSPPTQTVYVGGGYIAPASSGYVATAGPYCSTLIAEGPGLPATEQGACGTILILPAEAVMKQAMSIVKLVAVVVGLQLLGGVVLLRR